MHPTSWMATRSWSLILSNSSMHTTPRSASTMAPASSRFSPGRRGRVGRAMQRIKDVHGIVVLIVSLKVMAPARTRPNGVSP